VGTAPARFGNSVWDAVGSTGRRGLFYDEQVIQLKILVIRGSFGVVVTFCFS